MTISPPDVLVGVQVPRLEWIPPRVSSSGADAVEVAAAAGLILDPWQAYTLDAALGERADGSWAAVEVGLYVPRQNGKGAILEARELVGLFLLGERLIIHSAHNFDTALEAFRRLLELIESTPEFDSKVKRVSNAHGSEGLELKGGQRIRFRTRTAGGGRGFGGDVVILDEAMYLSEAQAGALKPIVLARQKPQIWYTGSAVDQEVHPNGMEFTRLRNRGLAGGDDRLAFLEWSASGDMDSHDPTDVRLWAQGNPGLGIRQLPETIAVVQRSMARRTFAVEILGIGDWPSEDAAERTIPAHVWQDAAADLTAPDAAQLGRAAFAVEVSVNRATATIATAYLRADSAAQVELVDRAEGTAWVAGRLAELVKAHDPCAVVVDPGGPAGMLIPAIEAAGIEITKMTARDVAQATGAFLTGIAEGEIRHPDEPLLNEAAAAVKLRPLGDAQAFERRNLAADIAPLMGVTVALHGLRVNRPQPPAPAPLLVESRDVPDELMTMSF